jgi:hypothetical protein
MRRERLDPLGVLSVFAFLVSAAACRKNLSIEEYRVAAAVKEYNLTLPRAYLAKSPDLVTCATSDERSRLMSLIRALEAKGWTLDARQDSMEASRIKLIDPRLADLETTEVWWYRQVDAKTGKETQAPRRIRYGLRYKVAKGREGWLVDRIEMLKSENLPLAR